MLKLYLISCTEGSLNKTVTLGVINHLGAIWGLKANLQQRSCKPTIDLKSQTNDKLYSSHLSIIADNYNCGIHDTTNPFPDNLAHLRRINTKISFIHPINLKNTIYAIRYSQTTNTYSGGLWGQRGVSLTSYNSPQLWQRPGKQHILK
jgi:hypothetical protein